MAASTILDALMEVRRPREQVRITLTGALRDEVDSIRRRWTPELVPRNPAHATVIYHDEADDPALLRERLAAAAASIEPFELVLEGARRFRAPALGAYLAVSDPGDAVERLRGSVLAPPFAPRKRVTLHVTLVHPAFSDRLPQAWPELEPLQFGRPFRVDRVELISGDRAGVSVTSFALGVGDERGRGRPD
jgi:2'-5' RNA ligase